MKKFKLLVLLTLTTLLLFVLAITAMAAADGDTESTAGFDVANYTYRVTDAANGSATYYINFKTAFAKTPEGGTLTVLKNGSLGSSALWVGNAKSFTVDGNGHTLTVGARLITSAECTGQVDFKNLTLTSTTNYCVDHYGTGTLTFTDCTLTAVTYVVHVRAAGTVKFLGNGNRVTSTGGDVIRNNGSNGAKGCSFVVEGGIFTANGTDNAPVFYFASQANLTVTGGTFIASTQCPVIYNYVGGTDDPDAGVEINVKNATLYGLIGLYVKKGTVQSAVLENVTHVKLAQSGDTLPQYAVKLSDTGVLHTLQLKNCSFTTAEYAVYVLSTGQLDTLQIKDCSFTTKLTALWLEDNTAVTIEGGSYTVNNSAHSITRFKRPSDLTIRGGSFTSGSSMPALYYDRVTGTDAVQINVSDATFHALGLLALRDANCEAASFDNVTFTSVTGKSETLPTYMVKVQGSGTLAALTVTDSTVTLAGAVVSTSSAVSATVEGGQYEIPYFNEGEVTLLVKGGLFINNSAKQTAVFFPCTVTLQSAQILSYGNIANLTADLPMPDHVTVFYGDRAFTAYYAQQDAAALYDPSNVDEEFKGAGVYLGSDPTKSGLRFITVLSDEMVAAAAAARAEGLSVQYGTLIAPADYVVAAGAFTVEALQSLPISETKVTYAKIPAVNSLDYNEAGEVISFSAALISLKEDNYNRTFAATPYVDINGYVYYGSTNAVENARSMACIARDALSSTTVYTPDEIALLEKYAAKKAIDLYLIAGQSNAAGTSLFDEDFAASNPKFTEGYENIHYIGTSANGTSTANRHRIVADSVKIGYGVSERQFGPELGIADVLSGTYNAESGRTAAIVRYAWGGTVLVDHTVSHTEGNWCPPSWLASTTDAPMSATKTGQLYHRFISHVRASVAYYENCGYDVNVKCLYWMQGESDVDYVDVYKSIFTCLVNDLRADISAITGKEKDANMPIFVGEISGSFAKFPEKCAAFIKMQQTLTDIENVFVVEQSRLSIGNGNGDDAHWGAENMLLVGQAAGTAIYNQLLKNGGEALPSPYLLGTPVAEVYDADGSLVGSYANLSYALNTVPDGGTVKLLTDLTVYGPISTHNAVTYTFDGNGRTITAKSEEGGALRIYGGNVTVLNLHLDYPSKTSATGALAILSGGDVTWRGGSVVAGDIAVRVYDDGTVLNIEGGSFETLESDGATYAVISSNKALALNISGGSFTGCGKGGAICANGGIATVTISGGSFTAGANAAETIKLTNAGSSLTVTGTPTINGTVSNAGTGYGA